MARRSIVLAGLLVVLAVGIGAERREGGSAERLAELRKTRVAVAEDVLKTVKALRNAGLSTDADVAGWTQKWLDARLDSAATKQERIAILKDGVQLAKEQEQLVDSRRESGRATPLDASAARYATLDADIRLAKAEAE